MKRLLFLIAVGAVWCVFADDVSKSQTPEARTEKAVEMEEKDDAPWFWGFGNYGLYSGYQLYGSLLNSEPTGWACSQRSTGATHMTFAASCGRARQWRRLRPVQGFRLGRHWPHLQLLRAAPWR